jgi:hypothetical protein
MATNHRDAELAGADWGLSSSIRLTRCTRESWRSFRAAYRGLGMPAAAGLEITGTRVSVSCKETRGKGGTRAPRLIRSGGTLFINVGGAAASILGVDEAAANRAPGSSPPSCFVLRKTKVETVSWPGWCWAAPAGLRPGGLRQVSDFPFFSASFLFFCFLFSVLLFLIQVCYFILQVLN